MAIPENQIDSQALARLAGSNIGNLFLPTHGVDLGFEGLKARAAQQNAMQDLKARYAGLLNDQVVAQFNAQKQMQLEQYRTAAQAQQADLNRQSQEGIAAAHDYVLGQRNQSEDNYRQGLLANDSIKTALQANDSKGLSDYRQGMLDNAQHKTAIDQATEFYKQQQSKEKETRDQESALLSNAVVALQHGISADPIIDKLVSLGAISPQEAAHAKSMPHDDQIKQAQSWLLTNGMVADKNGESVLANAGLGGQGDIPKQVQAANQEKLQGINSSLQLAQNYLAKLQSYKQQGLDPFSYSPLQKQIGKLEAYAGIDGKYKDIYNIQEDLTKNSNAIANAAVLAAGSKSGPTNRNIQTQKDLLPQVGKTVDLNEAITSTNQFINNMKASQGIMQQRFSTGQEPTDADFQQAYKANKIVGSFQGKQVTQQHLDELKKQGASDQDLQKMGFIPSGN